MRHSAPLLLLLPLLAGCNPFAQLRTDKKIAELEAEIASLQAENRELERRMRTLESELEAFRAGTGRSTSALPAPSSTGAAASVRCTKSGGRYRLTRGDFDTILSDMPTVVLQVRVVPFFQDGKSLGFRLFGIRPESLFDSCGFENGDVVRTVNGMDLSSPDRALDAYSRLKGASALEVELLRGGAPQVVSVAVEG